MSSVARHKKLVFKEVHDINERTLDVITQSSFADLMLNPAIAESLTRHNFQRPSPVQAKAIPLGLLGMDMLVQAKTGTGKTLVFAVLCADQLLSAEKREYSPQVMIVSPTREIAMQTHEVVRKICPRQFFSGLFVGGTDMERDKTVLKRGCQVAIGTTGRLSHLVKCRALYTKKITLFVLDEADKLMDDTLKPEVNYLFSSLTPEYAQVCVFSATYPRGLDRTLCDYMREPSLIRLNVEDVQLIGVKQYAIIMEKNDMDKQAELNCQLNRVELSTNTHLGVLLILLKSITFTQCLVFTNDQKRCSEISEYLKANEIAAPYFSSVLMQDARFKVMKDFRNFRTRIMVSSDLSARGIDAEHVNLIINMECPSVSEAYLHRIGRAGRFGTYGVALTILADDLEVHRFKLLVRRERVNVKLLNIADAQLPSDLFMNSAYYEKAENFKQFIAEEDTRLTNFWARTAERRQATNDGSSSNEENSNDICGTVKNIDSSANCSNTQKRDKVNVPLRSANRTKYYLRRELLAICDWATPEQWSEYGRRNLGFDDSEVIRSLARVSKKPSKLSTKKFDRNNGKKNYGSKTSIIDDQHSCLSNQSVQSLVQVVEEPCASNENFVVAHKDAYEQLDAQSHRYPRSEMLAICNLAGQDEWYNYAQQNQIDFNAPTEILSFLVRNLKIENERMKKKNMAVENSKNHKSNTTPKICAQQKNDDIDDWEASGDCCKRNKESCSNLSKQLQKPAPTEFLMRRPRAEYWAYMEHLMHKFNNEPKLRVNLVDRLGSLSLSADCIPLSDYIPPANTNSVTKK